jgi:hypothetical protein
MLPKKHPPGVSDVEHSATRSMGGDGKYLPTSQAMNRGFDSKKR